MKSQPGFFDIDALYAALSKEAVALRSGADVQRPDRQCDDRRALAQRNNDGEKADLKAGEIPQDW